MFEKLNTPQELVHFKLGAALKMENTVLALQEVKQATEELAYEQFAQVA